MELEDRVRPGLRMQVEISELMEIDITSPMADIHHQPQFVSDSGVFGERGGGG